MRWAADARGGNKRKVRTSGFKNALPHADIGSMKISSGIAEISLSINQGNRIVSEKAFLWPAYNA